MDMRLGTIVMEMFNPASGNNGPMPSVRCISQKSEPPIHPLPQTAKYISRRVAIECSRSPVDKIDVPARRPGVPPQEYETLMMQVRANDPSKPETRGRKRKHPLVA